MELGLLFNSASGVGLSWKSIRNCPLNKNLMYKPKGCYKAEHTENLLIFSSVWTSGLASVPKNLTGCRAVFLHFNVFAAIFSLPVVEDVQSGIKMWQDDGNEKVKKAHGKAVINWNAYLSSSVIVYKQYNDSWWWN